MTDKTVNHNNFPNVVRCPLTVAACAVDAACCRANNRVCPTGDNWAKSPANIMLIPPKGSVQPLASISASLMRSNKLHPTIEISSMNRKSTPDHILLSSATALGECRWFRLSAECRVLPPMLRAATPVNEQSRNRRRCLHWLKKKSAASITRDFPVPAGPANSIRKGSSCVVELASVIRRKAHNCSEFKQYFDIVLLIIASYSTLLSTVECGSSLCYNSLLRNRLLYLLLLLLKF